MAAVRIALLPEWLE